MSTMTDREMLELAATAIELENHYWGEVSTENLLDHVVITTHDDGRVSTHKWNPLGDDGDALRLATALMMRIEIFRNAVCVEAFDGEEEVREEVMVDPSATARLAIVRAAAEIGRRMSNE